MKIVEEFLTLQGEGKYLGVPSYFIRTTGCNLRCAWLNPDKTVTICDTPYTSFNPEKGYDFKFNSLSSLSNEIEHIVLTGGEPTIQPDIEKVVNELSDEGFQVTIETNGTKFIPNISGAAFISISPKLTSSYAQSSAKDAKLHQKNNIFIKPCRDWLKHNAVQLKFVYNQASDLDEILEIQRVLSLPSHLIYLMPQGISTAQFQQKSQEMFKVCIENGFNYTPRMHIDIFGNKRGI